MAHHPWIRAIVTLNLSIFTLCSINACTHTKHHAHSPDAKRDTLDTTQLLAVADAAQQFGDTLRAQQYLLAARNAGSTDAEVLPRLLRLYVEDGQYRLAIDTVQDQLRSHPEQHELRLLLADLYEATDLEVAAIEQYERVLATSPTEARAHFALGTLLHDHGRDLGRADRHYRTYLTLEPNGPHAAEARSLLLKELP